MTAVAFLLGLIDLFILALAVMLFEGTPECFKWAKESIKEHKENKAIKERIAKNKRLNSLEYGDFVTPYYSARNNYYDSKSSSVDSYVMSLFKKEKQNERK